MHRDTGEANVLGERLSTKPDCEVPFVPAGEGRMAAFIPLKAWTVTQCPTCASVPVLVSPLSAGNIR